MSCIRKEETVLYNICENMMDLYNYISDYSVSFDAPNNAYKIEFHARFDVIKICFYFEAPEIKMNRSEVKKEIAYTLLEILL